MFQNLFNKEIAIRMSKEEEFGSQKVFSMNISSPLDKEFNSQRDCKNEAEDKSEARKWMTFV